MGWITTSGYEPMKGLFTIREYLDRQFTEDDPRYNKFEILDSSLHGRSEYYAAARMTDRETGKSVVYAKVVMVSYKPSDPDGHTLGWKTMSEDMYPHMFNCPERILAKLDAPYSDDARRWRDECRRLRAEANTNRAAMTDGAIIRFKDPLMFRDEVERREFTVVKTGRKLRFRAEDGSMCRIPGAAKRAFDVVPKSGGG